MEGYIYEFRHRVYPVHVHVEQEKNRFKINAHIDLIHHIYAMISLFTSELLVELSRFLKEEDSESIIILLPVEHIERKKSDEIRAKDVELSRPVNETMRQETYLILDKDELEKKIEESRASTEKERKNYQERIKILKKKLNRETRRRREDRKHKMKIIAIIQENRRKIFKDIIDLPFDIWKKKALSHNEFEIDEHQINKEIDSLLSIVFGHLESQYKGFFIIEYYTFYNEYYTEKLSEVRNFIAEQVKEELIPLEVAEDVEEDILIQEDEYELRIKKFINDAIDEEYYQILHDARLNNQFDLNRKEIKNRFINSFRNLLKKEKTFENKGDILEWFLITFQERFNKIYRRLEERIAEIYEPNEHIGLKEAWRPSKENIISIILIIILTTLIVVWWSEYEHMRIVENFEWIDGHRWVLGICIFFIFIDVGLIIFVLCPERKIST
ncbi:MAG: hypothetical protein ACFFD2_18960 [Promethearchaeota archaeon]